MRRNKWAADVRRQRQRMLARQMGSSQFVFPNVGGDTEQPDPHGPAVFQSAPSLPGPQIRFLSQIFGAVRVAGQTQCEAIHMSDMLGQLVAHRSPSGIFALIKRVANTISSSPVGGPARSHL